MYTVASFHSLASRLKIEIACRRSTPRGRNPERCVICRSTLAGLRIFESRNPWGKKRQNLSILYFWKEVESYIEKKETVRKLKLICICPHWNQAKKKPTPHLLAEWEKASWAEISGKLLIISKILWRIIITPNHESVTDTRELFHKESYWF